MITLETLAGPLRGALRPLTSLPPRREITGVHVSELPDPTPFLAGGELLLTTGMPLRDDAEGGVEAYVSRLVDHGVAGLGVGLGPVHDALPPGLEAACADAGLPLFVIPPQTPFLEVSREFWRQLSRQDTERLSATVGAHHALVRAAASRTATTDVIRVLARAVGGWAATVAVDGTVRTVWPASAADQAEQAAAEVHRLDAAGPSAATFPVGDLDVVLHPVARLGNPVAFVATASPRPFPPSLRGLALTAAALLELQGEEFGRAHADRMARSGLAWLLLRGHVVAARSLSRDLGVDLPVCVRVVVAALVDRTSTPPTVDGATLAAHLPDAVAACVYAPGRLLAIVADDEFDAPPTDPRWRVVSSAPLRPDDVSAALSVLQARVDRLPGGAYEASSPWRDPGPEQAALALLMSYRRADLVTTLAAYLRHQGRLEPAAQDLGIHRNTLRHRLDIVARVAGLDLTDPDVSARWWLLLRSRGLA